MNKKAAVPHFSDNLKLSFKNVFSEKKKVFNEDACDLWLWWYMYVFSITVAGIPSQELVCPYQYYFMPVFSCVLVIFAVFLPESHSIV